MDCSQVRHVTIRSRWTPVSSASRGGREGTRPILHRTDGGVKGDTGKKRKRRGKGDGGGGSGGRSVEEESWEVDFASDHTVFEEKDDAFFADVGKTKDGAFVVINVHSKTTSEVYLLPARNSTPPSTAPVHGGGGMHGMMTATSSSNSGSSSRSSSSNSIGSGIGPTLLRRRRQGIEYYVDHSGDAFYLVTNSPGSKNGGSDVIAERGGDAAAVASAEPSAEPSVGATAAGEYCLVRVRQPWGVDSLEGIADAPWEAVSYGHDLSSSSLLLAGAAVNGKAVPITHNQVEASREEGNLIYQGPACDSHRADGAEVELSTAATVATAAAAAGTNGGGRVNGLGMFRGDYVGSTTATRGRRGTIQEMDLFSDRCVLYESCPMTGSPQLRVVPLAGSEPSLSLSSPLSSFVVSPPAPGGCHTGSGNGGSSGGCSGAGNSIRSNSGNDTGTGSSIGEGEGTTAAGAGEAAAAVSGASTLRPGVNSWFEARTARFSLSSPTAPEDVYDVCLESGSLELLRRTEVPGSPRFDGRDYWQVDRRGCPTIHVL